VLESYFRLCPICGTTTGAAQDEVDEENAAPDHVARIRETHPRAYERWSDEEDGRLKEMHLAGRTAAEIAGDLQRQPSAIRSRLQKMIG
jgi:uncharacterized Zn finger protein (UPF0148 family)